MTAEVDVLVPTYQRPTALAATLACLLGQDHPSFALHVSDQTEPSALQDPTVRAVLRVHAALGREVLAYSHLPPRGVAEHRDFLLRQAKAPYVLFLDDDVLMEGWVLGALANVLERERCGFVGAFPAGLSFADDIRPEQQRYEPWQGSVRPEVVEPCSPAWERYHLHRAANIWHAGQKLRGSLPQTYKVAWIGGCVLYDRARLLEVGGFSFWQRLPRYLSGEEVLVQALLMRRYGGCGIVPSGTYHQEVPTTVLNGSGTVDGHALDLLPEMLERLGEERASMQAAPPSRGVSDQP